MSDRMVLVAMIIVLLSFAGAVIEPWLPEPYNPGTYRPGPEEGVLPFQ